MWGWYRLRGSVGLNQPSPSLVLLQHLRDRRAQGNLVAQLLHQDVRDALQVEVRGPLDLLRRQVPDADSWNAVDPFGQNVTVRIQLILEANLLFFRQEFSRGKAKQGLVFGL